jgi:cytosine/adenosine deaminase-related metal-dependent hydrolase
MNFSVPKLLQDYGLLNQHILLSHATGSTDSEIALLKQHNVHISCTPATESQMAHGDLVGFRSDVLGSLGSDCHSNNPSSILHAMHVGLAVARALRNHQILEDGRFPRLVEPTTLQAFNLATVEGARAIGMDESIGRLQVGRKADVLVFGTESPEMMCAAEHDPLTAVVRHAGTSDIDVVIVGGKVLKRDGKLVDEDVAEEDLRGWEVCEKLKEIVREGGKLEWKEVRKELKRSREEIQKRIDDVSTPLAKKKVIEMWGNKGGENVLR